MLLLAAMSHFIMLYLYYVYVQVVQECGVEIYYIK